MEISLILGFIIILLLFFLIKSQRKVLNLQNSLNYLKIELGKCEEREKILNSLQKENEELKSEYNKILSENSSLKTKLDENERHFNEKLEIIKKSEENLKEVFNNLANEILESTNKKANESLSSILTPLNKDIKEFKEKIENLSLNEIKQLSFLENELKNLKELNSRLSKEAENLTKALKGDKKLQGIWGEVVLERVLELSGLRKDIEYEREVSLVSEDNKRYRPDVVIHLPDKRDIIIDSKVSLNAYLKYLETNDKNYLKEYVGNLKSHIDNLAKKDYEYLKGINSLDFIFMFVPLENALYEALNYDKELYEYAFKKRVILTSPTSLLSSLRAVEAVWRYERQTENIKEIVRISENLYNKLRLFLEDFSKVGDNLDKAKEAFDGAKNKLKDGRGNIFSQIKNLKEKAGIKPKKEVKERN